MCIRDRTTTANTEHDAPAHSMAQVNPVNCRSHRLTNSAIISSLFHQQIGSFNCRSHFCSTTDTQSRSVGYVWDSKEACHHCTKITAHPMRSVYQLLCGGLSPLEFTYRGLTRQHVHITSHRHNHNIQNMQNTAGCSDSCTFLMLHPVTFR